MTAKFDEKQKIVLGLVQKNLPNSLTPYADIAREAGLTEAETLDFLRSLKESGAIRRFGASIRHQRSGWAANAMTAWIATEAEAEQCGPIAAACRQISHAYYRPSSVADWPYTFYTMIHGRNDAECLAVIEDLKEKWPLKDCIVLRSLRELKKTSMIYFT